MWVYIPISPAYPEKESGFILKGWGVELRVLEWIRYIGENRSSEGGLSTV